jgi:hypothetical protein
MQLLSLHVDDASDSPGFFEGLFPWTVSEAYPCMSSTCHMPCAYTHPIGHVHLVQRISTLDNIEGQGDRWSGDLGHGTTNERRRHLTAIRELAR